MLKLSDIQIKDYYNKFTCIYGNRYSKVMDIDELQSTIGWAITQTLRDFNTNRSDKIDHYLQLRLTSLIRGYAVAQGKMKYLNGTYMPKRHRNEISLNLKDYSNDKNEYYIDKKYKYNKLDERDSFSNIIRYLKKLDLNNFGIYKFKQQSIKTLCIKILILFFMKNYNLEQISRKLRIRNFKAWKIKNNYLMPLLKNYYTNVNNDHSVDYCEKNNNNSKK